MTPGAFASLIEVSQRLTALLGQATEENALLVKRIADLEADAQLAARASTLRHADRPCTPSKDNPLGQCPHDKGYR